MTRRERGAVVPLVGITLIALVGFAAIALDIGYERVVRRDLQAVADVVSLDLVRRLDGSTRAEYEDALGPSVQYLAMQEAKQDSAERNGFVESATRTIGLRYGEVDATTRVFTEVAPTDVPSAIEVTVRDTDVKRWFSVGSGDTQRSAVAELSPEANFLIGSFLAGTDPDFDVGLLNRVLPRFVGSPVDDLAIDVLSWQGLANASLDMSRLATEMGLGSPDELADIGVFNARDVYLAAAQVMEDDGNTAAAQVFQVFATETDGSATVDFGDIWGEQGGSDGELAAGANPSIPGLFFLNASAFSIDGNNLVSVPNFDVGIPGITNSTLTVEVIEAPQLCAPIGSYCRIGDSRTTSQVRVRLENNLDLDLSALLPLARLTGTLVTDTQAAGATGTLDNAYCAGNSSGFVPGIEVGVVAQPVTTTASESLTLAAQVLFAVVNVARVDVAGAVTVASGTGGSASFAYPGGFLPDVGTAGLQRVGSPTLGLSSVLNASAANVTVLNAGVPLATSVNTINAGLSPVLGSIDNFVVRRLSRTLGLFLGGADVGAVDLRCAAPRLVG